MNNLLTVCVCVKWDVCTLHWERTVLGLAECTILTMSKFVYM